MSHAPDTDTNTTDRSEQPSGTGSARLTWECTNPSPDFVWSLGERVEHVGKPAQVKNAVAFVERTASRNWRWVSYVGGGSRWGFEPSCNHAMAAAERALPNTKLSRPASVDLNGYGKSGYLEDVRRRVEWIRAWGQEWKDYAKRHAPEPEEAVS